MKHVTVAAAILIKDGKVFSAQRKDFGEMAKRWEFPGGKLEEGESGEAAIVREIKEELDTDIRVIKYLSTVEYQYKTFSITMSGYLCEILAGDLVLSEHLCAKWLGKDELYSVPWADADIPLVQAIEGMLV
ncbi:ADP-ribose pyrophosphatase [Sphaerochaeta pleomorpha str. Grapes]|uniref:8-oxo-dGTP diphosphatase n=1 Tax=Sphaerochaeta pleomorpha (strain ATCC BAA-1885 / DSM 22778 / Grapes) TaxID=158190 RepID=G8QQQ0_SPHPG|nr:(deoxy)nucleoside triphosphate pyrophosphohydrolase [Sphaerochaeta pleomorpha]AEV28681.1 ADP-ribose pyrophosphatase [Sphaerochaeta pleomorpha str. Grapes]